MYIHIAFSRDCLLENTPTKRINDSVFFICPQQLFSSLHHTLYLGTFSPSSSPVFTVLTDHQGCPEEYSSNDIYEANSHVSVLAADGTNFLVYQCSSDVHQSRFCNQFAPNHLSQLGWIKVGFCDGSTIAPTSSPNFNRLTEIEGGCPEQFSIATEYKAGDQVSVFSDTSSDQALVYRCKEYPYSGYCRVHLEVFAPYSENGDIGWKLLGYCAGTSSPTMSPVSYPDAKCRYYVGKTPVIIKEWSLEDLSTYSGGTKVRVNEAIFVSYSFYRLLIFFSSSDLIIQQTSNAQLLFSSQIEMQELPIFRLVPQQCLPATCECRLECSLV